jgi:hypothetical protein
VSLVAGKRCNLLYNDKGSGNHGSQQGGCRFT